MTIVMTTFYLHIYAEVYTLMTSISVTEVVPSTEVAGDLEIYLGDSFQPFSLRGKCH